MRTDYKNINKFEVGVVSVIAVGFIVVGIVLFASLTPRAQTDVAAAFEMFDIHTQVLASVETVKFVYNIPNEFYKEFYIAFEQVAVVPYESIEMPVAVASELIRIASTTIKNMSDQVGEGYAAQNQFQIASAPQMELAYNGKVMGAATNIADKLTSVVPEEKPRSDQLDLYYSYSANDYGLQITRMVERVTSSYRIYEN